MNLIDKAFALCSEIESRQQELRVLLEQIAAMQAAGTVSEPNAPVGEVVSELPTPEVVIETETTPAEPQSAQTATVVAGDIRKAFTINDRFRFRRELFGGDDRAMQDVIAHLAELSDFAAAERYISSLGWDRDSEAVGEFLGIINTYFNGYHL